MTKSGPARRTRRVSTDLVTTDVGNGWRSRAVLPGESREDYERLLAQLTADLSPRDLVEEFWVRDVVDLVWESGRLRRLKVALLESSSKEGKSRILGPLSSKLGPGFDGVFAADGLAESWYLRNPQALRAVNALLQEVGLTLEAVMAQTLSAKLDDIERIDRMISLLEARRSAAIRELDRHREALARRADRAAQAIEDAAFTEVPANDGHGREGDQHSATNR